MKEKQSHPEVSKNLKNETLHKIKNILYFKERMHSCGYYYHQNYIYNTFLVFKTLQQCIKKHVKPYKPTSKCQLSV